MKNKTVKLKIKIHILLFMATLWVAMSFRPAKTLENSLCLFFEHYVGDRVLQMDTVTYKNELGQAYTITKFKYYISNIRLHRAGESDVAINEYYFLNEEEEPTKKISLQGLPSGIYTGIDFMIGVDSLHNCSGAQSGALDPINGMFWAWNSGYIFLKLEGSSPSSHSTGNRFEFHIGGYKPPYNCIRFVSLSFLQPLRLNGDHEVHLKTDIAEFFKDPETIDFSKISSVTDFHNAPMIADNYKDMFSVISIK